MRARAGIVAGFIAVLLLPALASAASPVLSGFETRLTSRSGDQYRPAISGNVVVYTDYQGDQTDVWYVDLTTGLEHPVATDPGWQELTGVSNGLVVYSDYNTQDVVVFDIAGGTSQNLTYEQHSTADAPAISQGLVAWSDNRDGNSEIYARDLSTNEERRITSSPAYDEFPKVSGRSIVWHRCAVYEEQCDIWFYDWATQTTRQISDHPGNERYPDIDGNSIVYVLTNSEGQYEVAFYSLDTGIEKILVMDGDQDGPHVSGEYVAFDTPIGSSYHVSLWHPSTDDVFPITSGPGAQYLNDIEGDRIVYSDDRNGNLDVYMYTFQVDYPSEESCRQVVLEASRSYRPSRWNDDFEIVAPSMRFALPADVPVVAGNSGNQWLTLGFGTGWNQTYCRYRGGSAQAHPSSPEQLALATRYVFQSCTDGSAPGSVVETTRLWLHVDNGDNLGGATRVRLALDEASPCAGAVPLNCHDTQGATPLVDATFERTTGKPNVFAVPFLAVAGPGLVCVDNGVDGAPQVHSGSIWVNSDRVVGPSDWAPEIVAQPTLQSVNLLTVKLSSTPGAAARIRIFGQKTSASAATAAAITSRMRPAASSKLYAGDAEAGDDPASGCSQAGGGALAPLALLLLLALALTPRFALVPTRSRRR
ncbi:MAG: hypothetical protein HY901_25315 [Deltaproteobacteria bacterium]|nr:hypothetical protein [Deltaproteobacteria bacterium]